MNRRNFKAAIGAAVATPAILGHAHAATASQWSLEADVAECCSCEIPCPCNFGRRTDLQCNGNRLIQITDGQIDGASLAGISFLATFEMGKWVRIYVDDSMSEASSKAFERIFPLAFGGFKKLMVAMEHVPMTVSRGEGEMAYSVPDSNVQMKRMVGLDGKPITIDNLPSRAFFNYTQYESVVHTHKSDSAEFSHSGTNGFTSRMIVSSGA